MNPTTSRIYGLADAEFRRRANDPKRAALFQARRRLFWVAMRRGRTVLGG